MSSVLLVGDFRSPHARAWYDFFTEFAPKVTLLSSAPVDSTTTAHPPDLLSRTVTKGARWLQGVGTDTVLGGPMHRGAVLARHRLWSLRARTLATEIRRLSRETQADWIHALRLPWEGIAVHMAQTGLPWSLSLWGSDLATQAPQSRLLMRSSRSALAGVHGLTADCHRDVRLASDHGLPPGTPTIVVPGNLGLPDDEIRTAVPSQGRVTIVCPRGLLPHIRWRELITAVRILRRAGIDSELVFLDVARPPTGYPDISFCPRLPRPDMLALARTADIVVSPGTSDGIPNSVLEFMSQGAVPVLSDLVSQRELVTDGVNGFLCDPLDPRSIADALLKAAVPDARVRMSVRNADLLTADYSRTHVESRLVEFFESLR